MTVNGGGLWRWSRVEPIEPLRLLIAAVALAGPVGYGLYAGHPVHGSLAALGAMATMAGVGSGRARLVGAALIATVAGTVGVAVGGQGWFTAAAVVGLVGVAAVVGGFSRGFAELAAIFSIFTVIATGLAAVDPLEAAQWFGIGAGWALLLGLPVVGRAAAQPPYRKLWARWRRNLRRAEGWEYAARLLPGLAVAEAIGVLWHQPKGYWIALAVVIVVRRRGDSLLRATQRALGTTVGVVIGGLLILCVPPSWVIVAVVAVLAGARPFLKSRNYTAYAVVMTPLLVLLLELGRTPELSTIGYRLVDTVIGCAIAVVPTLVRRSNVG